jgi:hypothetical protein
MSDVLFFIFEFLPMQACQNQVFLRTRCCHACNGPPHLVNEKQSKTQVKMLPGAFFLGIG